MHSSYPLTILILFSFSTFAAAAQNADFPAAPVQSSPAQSRDAIHSLPDEPLTQGHNYVLPPDPEVAVLPKSHVILDPEHEFTLSELIDVAEREHPETRIAWESARNAALGAGIARSTYLPRVTANTIGGFQDSTGNTSAFGVTTRGSGSASGSVSAVSLEWLLFDFGGRKNIVDAAKKVSYASNIAFTGSHQKVIHEVCIAYYAYLAAIRHIHTTTTALANAREIQTAAEARYSNGVGTVLESTQARLATAQSQFAKVQAEGTAKDAYSSLLAAMGLSPLQQIKVASLERRKLPGDALPSAEQVVKDALARRPDVLAAYATEQSSLAAIKAAEAQYRPKIFLAGTGAYVSGQLGLTAIPPIGEQLPTLNISGNHWNSTVLLGLTVPVFDAHARANAISQAKNNSAKASATLNQIRIVAIREVVGAQNALETSIAANEAAAVMQDAAQVSYDANLDSYRNGVGTITASVAAQTQLLQTQLAADDTYSSALSAAATLAFATGTLGSSPQ